MSRRKDDAPSVATYADHEVITPPHKLRKAVAAAEAVDDPVARAEAGAGRTFERIQHMDGGRMRAARNRTPERQEQRLHEKNA